MTPEYEQCLDFSRIHRACRRLTRQAPPTVFILLLMVLPLPGCVSPAMRLQQQAEHQGFEILELPAREFKLQAFLKLPANVLPRLHVYLEGDGLPWKDGRVPSAEPTTRESIVLPLMAIDPLPSLYLARPCYNGHALDAGCNNALWTQARYGAAVVDAMTQGLVDFCRRHQVRELVLIGHSGGGSLAMLLAGRLPQTRAVVTLAGNYDIDVWADYHGYLGLRDSLNPANLADSGVMEWHVLARRDAVVPPVLFEQRLRQRKKSRVMIIDADHHQGWIEIWPSLLEELP